MSLVIYLLQVYSKSTTEITKN